jgi:hypothetical protein
VHEIKHDGFRIIARKDGTRVRLYTRNGRDFAHRFRLIVDAIAGLRSRSCIIDGEAVACGADGVPSFDRIRYRRHDASVFLYAFDLLELNGDDLRREPLQVRKTTLVSVLAKAAPGLRLNEHGARGRRDHLPPRLQDGSRGYRVEAEGFSVPQRSVGRLAQDEEPGPARRCAGRLKRTGEDDLSGRSGADRGDDRHGHRDRVGRDHRRNDN